MEINTTYHAEVFLQAGVEDRIGRLKALDVNSTLVTLTTIESSIIIDLSTDLY